MASGSQAVTGTGRRIWKVGSRSWRISGTRPMRRPSGRASSTASAKPPKTRASEAQQMGEQGGAEGVVVDAPDREVDEGRPDLEGGGIRL